MQISLAILADILFTIGVMEGVITKTYLLMDKDTVQSRKANLPKLVMWPVTAIIPILIKEMWLSAFTAGLNFFIYLGLYLWRAPENEDWLGRKTEL